MNDVVTHHWTTARRVRYSRVCGNVRNALQQILNVILGMIKYSIEMDLNSMNICKGGEGGERLVDRRALVPRLTLLKTFIYMCCQERGLSETLHVM